MWNYKNQIRKTGKLASPVYGQGIADTLGSTALDLFATKGLPWLGKRAVDLGRYGASQALKNPRLQKKAIDYTLDKLTPMIQNVGSQAMNELSTKVRPRGSRGGAVPRRRGPRGPRGGAVARRRGPTTVDKIGYVLSNFVTPAPSFAGLAKILAGQAFKGVSDNVSHYKGGAIDIHKAILKVAPKKGFVMPGHRYTGPGNPLDQQLKYDPDTGEILEIYQQPTGKTDAVSMQHDVDYSVCENKPKGDRLKCKNVADRKMVKTLDAIPWKDRQWGHAVARNAIAAKSKLGMGVGKPKNGKSRRVKKSGKKN
nr:TPA_asm: PLA2X [Corynactis coral adintovirus]